MLCPRSMRTRPWSTFSESKHLFSKNLKHGTSHFFKTSSSNRIGSGCNKPSGVKGGLSQGQVSRRKVINGYQRLPLSEQEVVRFDVGVDDVDVVQLLHHVQDTDGEVHDQRLRHHLIAQGFIHVHRVLKEESQFEDMKEKTAFVFS